MYNQRTSQSKILYGRAINISPPYSQRLAPHVSVRFSIDPTEKTEQILAILSSIFLGKLIIEDKNRAILEAKAGIAILKLWCDGSKLDSGGTGAPVIWQKGTEKEWQNQEVICITVLST